MVPGLAFQSLKTRTSILICFWAAILLSVPLWIKTTTITRLALPVERLHQWQQRGDCPVQLNGSLSVHVAPSLLPLPTDGHPDAPNTFVQQVRHLIQDHLQAKASLERGHSLECMRWEVNADIGYANLSVVEKFNSQFVINVVPGGQTKQITDVPVSHAVLPNTISDAALRHFLSWRGEKVSASSDGISTSSVQQDPRVIQYSKHIRILFSIMNQDITKGVAYDSPIFHSLDLEANGAEIQNNPILKVVNELEGLHDFHLESQVQWFAPLSFQPTLEIVEWSTEELVEEDAILDPQLEQESKAQGSQKHETVQLAANPTFQDLQGSVMVAKQDQGLEASQLPAGQQQEVDAQVLPLKHQLAWEHLRASKHPHTKHQRASKHLRASKHPHTLNRQSLLGKDSDSDSDDFEFAFANVLLPQNNQTSTSKSSHRRSTRRKRLVPKQTIHQRRQWAVEWEDLKVFVNSAEWSLSSTVPPRLTRPSKLDMAQDANLRATDFHSQTHDLHFLVYIPSSDQSPLLLRDPVKGGVTETKAWLIPQWGGVFILNPPQEASNSSSTTQSIAQLPADQVQESLKLFAKQLEILLGLVPNSPTQRGFDPAQEQIQRLARLEALLCRRIVETSRETIDTLTSIIRLVAKIENLGVGKEVQADVEKAIEMMEKLDNYLALTPNASLQHALELSYQAQTLASRAFFNPSMLGLLYFPDEHKYAVYTPLFGPLLVPLSVALLRCLKEWMHDKKASGQNTLNHKRIRPF